MPHREAICFEGARIARTRRSHPSSSAKGTSTNSLLNWTEPFGKSSNKEAASEPPLDPHSTRCEQICHLARLLYNTEMKVLFDLCFEACG